MKPPDLSAEQWEFIYKDMLDCECRDLFKVDATVKDDQKERRAIMALLDSYIDTLEETSAL